MSPVLVADALLVMNMSFDICSGLVANVTWEISPAIALTAYRSRCRLRSFRCSLWCAIQFHFVIADAFSAVMK